MDGNDKKGMKYLLNGIIRVDKTPKYEYSKTDERDADNLGNFPNKGKRWLTPSELAGRALSILSKMCIAEKTKAKIRLELLEKLKKLEAERQETLLKTPVKNWDEMPFKKILDDEISLIKAQKGEK